MIKVTFWNSLECNFLADQTWQGWLTFCILMITHLGKDLMKVKYSSELHDLHLQNTFLSNLYMMCKPLSWLWWAWNLAISYIGKVCMFCHCLRWLHSWLTSTFDNLLAGARVVLWWFAPDIAHVDSNLRVYGVQLCYCAIQCWVSSKCRHCVVPRWRWWAGA